VSWDEDETVSRSADVAGENRKCRQWLIAARPSGRDLLDSDFRLEVRPIAALGEGEVLVRTSVLSFDPALKGWMENVASYAAPTEIGGLMPGDGAGEVVESRCEQFPVGSRVVGPIGWTEYGVVQGSRLRLVPPGLPDTVALGALGMTGLTAYVGLIHVGKPRPGDVVVVTGAAGAVGSVAGQIARIGGCRVIGIAGGRAKCEALTSQLGFDAAIDYKTEKTRSRLRELAPQGIDVLFDNVGGTALNDCLSRLAFGARVVICGAISRYNDDPRSTAQSGPPNYFNVVFTNATMQGFLVMHYERHHATAYRRLEAWLRDGRLRSLEDVAQGFENAPRALMRIFSGANLGKQLLRI
jgi:NADPH-dependent curcumin reductase CurA